MGLNFIFKSPDHLRYENGRHVSGPHGGAGRVVKVEPNISGGQGYTVTIFNSDGNHPLWQNNVQMAPKQMKVVQENSEKIVLRGYGQDAMGGSFADYGLTIHMNKGQVIKCVLHLHDRNADIEYLNGDNSATGEPEIVSHAKNAKAQYHSEKITDGRQLLIQIYRSIKNDPTQLKNVVDYSPLGSAFILMLDQNLSDDIDTLQMMASVGYLCISKAIKNNPNNLNLYKDRLLILRVGHEPLKYTVMSALDMNSDGFMSLSHGLTDIRARDAIYRMEIADLESHPVLYRQVPFFKERKEELDQMIEDEFFLPEKTVDKIVKTGLETHDRVFKYLNNKVIDEADVNF